MVARPRELLRELREGKETVKALKAIKNQVIGNKFKKNAFVTEGAVEEVLDVLRNTKQISLPEDQADLVQQQAAIVLGSLSLSEAGLARLLSHEGVTLLVRMLHSGDEAVVEAGLWAVKMAVQQSTSVPSYLITAPAGADGGCPFADASAAPAVPVIAAAGPAMAAAPAAAVAAAASTPVRLDAAAMSAVVRCLAAGANRQPNANASAAGGQTDGSGDAGSNSGSGGRGGGGGDGSSGSRLGGVAVRMGGRGAAIAALAAAVVACCCRREEERALAIAAGAPEGLLSLLLSSERPDTQVAALEGLSLMLPYKPSACALALARPEVYGRLFALLRDPTPSVRLLAASCVATLSRVPGCQQPEAMQRAALPVLLRLLVQPATRPHVPAVLARLIEGSEPLQKAAADADTVRLLAGLLASEAAAAAAVPPPTPLASSSIPPATAATADAGAATCCPGSVGSPGGAAGAAAAATAAQYSAGSRLREGCLRALGSLCLNRDDSRKQLLEAKVLRHIVRSLEDPHDGVREAAALCVRALSRCVRTLRGGLLEGGGELAPVLVGLLQDGNKDVQASAAAAVCNLVLDFSAAKSAVLAAGGLGRLVALSASEQLPLRRHATWALANLLYRADNGVRVQLMQALPWSRMRLLLSDSDPGVVEQALVIVRNLCMGDRHHIAAALEWAGCGPSLQRAAAAASDAAAAMSTGTTTAAPVLRISHLVRSHQELLQHQHQHQQAGTVREEGQEEELLEVLQERILKAAAAAATAATATSPSATAPAEEQGMETSPLRHTSTTYAAASSPVAATATDATPMEAEPPTAPFTSTSTSAPQAAVQATHSLYAVANLLTGGREVKDLVAARRPLLAAVAAHLTPAAGDLALPAVWCAINLTWPSPGGSSSSSGAAATAAAATAGAAGAATAGASELEGREALASRCRALMEVGAAELLQELGRSHPSRDVQERARTALEQLRNGAGAAAGAATMLVV